MHDLMIHQDEVRRYWTWFKEHFEREHAKGAPLVGVMVGWSQHPDGIQAKCVWCPDARIVLRQGAPL